MAIKLNLGSGDTPLDGYINLDRKTGNEVYPLVAYADNSVDQIRASHVLEHFGRLDTFKVLQHWVSKLKVGGVLKIAVPDFAIIAAQYVKGNRDPRFDYAGFICGGQIDDNDYHKAIFDRPGLEAAFNSLGLIDIKKWESTVNDCASLHVSLNLQGTKARNIKLRELEMEEKETTKIVAVMSTTRLAFTDNIFSGMAAFVPLGITYERGYGVFWGQVLTRMICKHLDDNTDYIITCDYDTYFTKKQVVRLLQLIVENPDADAITTLQVKRECDNFLIAKRDESGSPVRTVRLDKDLIPINSGHFGLTVFRASAFKKLKKPWFLGVPNADGEWGEGRQDEDIYFWNNFKSSGLKLFLAHQIGIGHLQLVCTFPGRPEDNWKPTHKYMNDVQEVGVPDWCEPEVKMLK